MLPLLAVAAAMAACSRVLTGTRLVPVANDGGEVAVANAGEGEAVFQITEDGSFFIPFGEYPHKLGKQIFDRAAANAILASHNSPLERIKRWAGAKSYPVYIGHPDMPGTKDTDKRAYGWIETIAVENEGMRLTPKWSEPGQQLVANAHFKFYSPYWFTKKEGKGIKPVAMISMGLTNNPNIPVPALANEVEDEPSDELAGIRSALGLEDGAANDAVLAEITRLSGLQALLDAANATVTTVTGERDAARGELATANEALTLAGSERDTARGDLAAANEAIDALREYAVDEALANAVSAGRMTPAEKDSKRGELMAAAANELGTALGEIGKLPVKFKTVSTTGDLGTARTQLVKVQNDTGALHREERRTAVANELERIPENKPEAERKRIAWARAAQKNPELFGKQESPGAAA